AKVDLAYGELVAFVVLSVSLEDRVSARAWLDVDQHHVMSVAFKEASRDPDWLRKVAHHLWDKVRFVELGAIGSVHVARRRAVVVHADDDVAAQHLERPNVLRQLDFVSLVLGRKVDPALVVQLLPLVPKSEEFCELRVGNRAVHHEGAAGLKRHAAHFADGRPSHERMAPSFYDRPA